MDSPAQCCPEKVILMKKFSNKEFWAKEGWYAILQKRGMVFEGKISEAYTIPLLSWGF